MNLQVQSFPTSKEEMTEKQFDKSSNKGLALCVLKSLTSHDEKSKKSENKKTLKTTIVLTSLARSCTCNEACFSSHMNRRQMRKGG